MHYIKLFRDLKNPRNMGLWFNFSKNMELYQVLTNLCSYVKFCQIYVVMWSFPKIKYFYLFITNFMELCQVLPKIWNCTKLLPKLWKYVKFCQKYGVVPRFCQKYGVVPSFFQKYGSLLSFAKKYGNICQIFAKNMEV